MGISNPISARKTREAAGNAVKATKELAKYTGDLRDAVWNLWFGRGFFGRLKFLFLGK